MRINLLLLVLTLLLGTILWATLSGALFGLGFCFLLLFLVVTVFYADKAVLFFLGAREVRSSDVPAFHQAAAQEAYKLSVPVPRLFFYEGSFERAFILQNRDALSIVLGKKLMTSAETADLCAICFELLLQAKKGTAGKRTRIMYVVGLFSWISHSVLRFLLRPFRSSHVRVASDMFLNYMLHPWLDLIFRLCLGEGHFRRLKTLLQEYPAEWSSLQLASRKLEKPALLYSLPTRRLLSYTSAGRTGHYQNILALEVLPHEWDFLFNEGATGA